MNIVPSAASFEQPRERKEDVKPGMSNVKVNNHSTICSVEMFLVLLTKQFLSDILYNIIGNDSGYCIGCLWYLVLSKAQRIITKIMVT